MYCRQIVKTRQGWTISALTIKKSKFLISIFREMMFSWNLSLSISYGDIIMMSLSFLLFQEMLSALGPNTDFERMVEHCLERISRQCSQFLLKTENKMK